MSIIDLVIRFNYIQGKRFEHRIAKSKDIQQKYKMLKMLSKFYVKNYSGILYSRFIESELIRFSIDLQTFKPKTASSENTLHVATELYNTGGHTRLINSWIQNDKSNRHDIFVNEGTSSPDWLIDTVKAQGGQLFYNSGETWLQKAACLRNVASSYSKIILHVHPDDLISTVALGHGFNGTVFLYNHADHVFWIGSSVADVVLDMNGYASRISQNLRLVNRSHIVPIPLEDTGKSSRVNTREAKKRYGIPDGKRIFLTIASEYKFSGDSDVFFREALNVPDANSCWVLIGPSPDSPKFRKIAKKSRGALIPLGIKNKTEVEEILSLADLYIDSFPFSSFTSMLQALKSGVPVITAYPYELPDCLLKNRVESLKGIAELPLDHLKSAYLIGAADAASVHSGDHWRQVIADLPFISDHKVSLQDERFYIHPYPRSFYKNQIRYKRWVRQCSMLPLRPC